MDVRGLKIWIVGAARSGIAAARVLHEHGAHLFVTDSNTIGDDQKKVLDDLKIPFEEGQHSIDRLLAEAQLVVVSPSIPLDKPLPMAARQAKIPVVSEIEVASWFLPQSAFVVGITGTNGKSTTTHYGAQLFALGQRNSVACGNYGRPLADALLDPARYNAFIVELSSYQLETTYSLRPNVSIFLNLQLDHQARYGSMDEYLKAKWRLVTLTRPDGLAIIDEPVLRRAIELGLALPESHIVVIRGCLDANAAKNLQASLVDSQKLQAQAVKTPIALPVPTYGTLSSLPLEVLVDAEKITHLWFAKFDSNGSSVQLQTASANRNRTNIELKVDEPCLPGDHNQINIGVVSLAALHDGLHPNIIRAQWNQKTSAYQHLPHRLEAVARNSSFVTSQGKSRNVRVINDSKATNVESTLVAVKSFSAPIRLLLGGEPKGDFYGDLIPFLGKTICKVYPFGKAASLISQQLAGNKEFLAEPSLKMIDAAQKALDQSSDGDVLLLSPACASFDEFKNFEHRGDAFKHWILQKVEK